MQHLKIHGLLALISILVMPAISTVHAAEPEDIIKYRKNVMKAIGSHTSAAHAIIQGDVDYKKHLAEHVRSLQALTKDIPALFPKDSDFGKTKAKNEVWTKRAEFEKSAKDSADKVAAFAKAVKGNNQEAMDASYEEMSDSCKACHKDFRKENN